MFCKKQIARDFSLSAQHYNVSAHIQKQAALILASLIDSSFIKEKKILDVGSGTGFVSEAFCYPDVNWISVDIAWGMMQFLKQKNPAAWGVCADADYLPFREKMFDIVFSNLMLQWSSNIKKTFFEITRVLKEEGFFIFSLLGSNTLNELHYCWACDRKYIHSFIEHEALVSFLKEKYSFVEIQEKTFCLYYQNAIEVMHHLKQIGAQNKQMQRAKGLLGKEKLKDVLARYEHFRNEEGLLPATYQLFFCRVRK